MYKEKKVIAIIPARGGSKAIPNKNIKLVNQKPLIAYTIEPAKKSKYIDRLIVSTDSKKIEEVSLKCGAEVPFLRPAKLSTDTAKTIDAIIYTIDQLKMENENYDYVLTLQPTQPLRTTEQIDESIKMMVDHDWDSLVSISKVSTNPILIRTLKSDGFLKKLLNIRSDVRRQNFDDYYKINGLIYLNRIDQYLTNSTSLNDNAHGYVIDSKYDLDIDTPDDLERFKHILSKNSISS